MVHPQGNLFAGACFVFIFHLVRIFHGLHAMQDHLASQLREAVGSFSFLSFPFFVSFGMLSSKRADWELIPPQAAAVTTKAAFVLFLLFFFLKPTVARQHVHVDTPASNFHLHRFVLLPIGWKTSELSRDSSLRLLFRLRASTWTCVSSSICFCIFCICGSTLV